MKLYFFLGLSLVIIRTTAFSDDRPELPPFPAGNSTTVMSYNISLDNGEGKQTWTERKKLVAQVIRSKRPEILGVQECSMSQTAWIQQDVGGYDWYALQEEGNTDHSNDMCPIFYKKSAYDLAEHGSFWLPTKTKDKSASTVNWVELDHKMTGKKIFAFNMRFQECSQEAHAFNARLLQERVNQIADGQTFVIVGDLSCEPHQEAVQSFSTWAKDSEQSCLVRITDRDETYIGWDKKKEDHKRVDYIFLSKDIPANSYEVVDISYKEQYPSDHLPVYCKLRLE